MKLRQYDGDEFNFLIYDATFYCFLMMVNPKTSEKTNGDISNLQGDTFFMKHPVFEALDFSPLTYNGQVAKLT